MKRPATTWMIFALGLLATLGGLAWLTNAALDLDGAEAESRLRADREESIRLALWRMDSAIAPLLAAEGARPYFAYLAFYPADQAYTRMFKELRPGEVHIASPLLNARVDHVRLHFQIAADGAVTSPQVPTSNMLDVAEGVLIEVGEIDRRSATLARLRALVADARLADRLPPPPERIEPVRPLVMEKRPVPGPQGGRGGQEYEARWTFARNVESQSPAPTRADVRPGVLGPVWIGDELLLARRVVIGPAEVVQGLWLDGPGLERFLLSQVRDLLPAAALHPVEKASEGRGTRRLAALPLRLSPGPAPPHGNGALTPIRVALLIAWGAALFGAVAAAGLLRSALRLGERRAAFVSAVTHELRTPLTTFRMYTELLASDMVDGAKRGRYLDTLQRESDRLGHLVENVLAYAGLERGKNGGETETVELGEVLERLRPTLTEAAERAGSRLVMETDADAGPVCVDRSAVERIVRNLVDNACKYAAGVDDTRIHVVLGRAGDAVTLSVTDHGPGISRSDAGRIFRPFRKSATEAAHSAPGVGLGLALSRTLARAMGGDLRLVPSDEPGARFELSLPGAASAPRG